jgi:MATE family multidrug resistance protein
MLEVNYKTILKVAIPLMISSFIQSIVMITDASFLSRYSILSFDASGNAGLLYITMFIALLGLSDGVQILIARRIGENLPDKIGRIFGTSILTIAIFVIFLFSISYYFIPYILPLYSKHQDLAEAQISFLSIRSYALFFCIISLPIQAFLLAIGKTWVVLVSSLIIAFSNIVMDYLFIFGFSSFIPSMGLEGAALASTFAEGLGMIFLCLNLIVSKDRKKFQLLRHLSFNFTSFKELLKIGTPLFFQGFMALFTWTVFFTWIEQIGKTELTISQNIRAIYFLAFVPILGFAATTKTYISQYLGAKKMELIPLIQKRIQLLTILFLILFFHGAILYPTEMIRLINPTEIYIEQSANILRYIAGSFLIFGLISVKFQTVNGSGNTSASFLIECLSVCIYILFSYLFIKVWKVDIFWIWSVEYIYFGFLGILSITYLNYFNWQNKKI